MNDRLIGLSKNTVLKPLLKNPFFGDLAWRVLQTGTTFDDNDGEQAFRDAVWRNVIAKEAERANGLRRGHQEHTIYVNTLSDREGFPKK